MKKNLIFVLMSFFWIKAQVLGAAIELNASYDFFRGIPDGTWNGNVGAFVGVNSSLNAFDCLNAQLGGSYGVYNWDGRGNVVFANPKNLEQIGFLTVGLSSSYDNWNGGLVYDRIFTDNYSIYHVSPSFDQLRFQVGKFFCSDEVGLWGTVNLTKSHHNALGIPIVFKAIGQLNLFWRHFFENCSQGMVWVGLPYSNSHSHKKVGNGIFGFTVRLPMTCQFYFDGHGSYMFAKHAHGVRQSKNYDASLCLGITYFFDNPCECVDRPYMPVANHSNFLVVDYIK